MAIVLSIVLFSIRIGLVILLLLGMHTLFRKKCHITKQTGLIILVVTAVIATTALFLLPLERWCITYTSPEEAFYLNERKKPDLVLEGDESAFVVSEQASGTRVAYYEKVEGGWKKSKTLFTDKKTCSVSSEVLAYVYRIPDTDDYYIHISFSQNVSESSHSVSDNRNGEFEALRHNEYYVYVNGLDSTYRLIIDGEEYKLVSLW